MSAPSHLMARDLLDLPSDYSAPRTNVENLLATIWSDIFEIDTIGIDDDFFDLGGDSVKATRISAEIDKELGIQFKSGQIVERPTIREIAEILEDSAKRELPSHMLPLRTGGDRVPLFIVHGAAGFLFPSAKYMSAFHDDQPVYGFQVPGFDGQMEPLERVEDIADQYLEAVLAVEPDGPWHLAGMCSGGWITFEMARKLKAMGKPLGRIIIIDPYIERGRMRDQFEKRRRAYARGPVSIIGSALSRLKLAKFRYTHRRKVFKATGHWISETNDHALDIPEVRDWILAQRRGTTTSEGGTETYANENELAKHKTDGAILASEKLKRAFHRYTTEASIDDHVDIIASEFLSRKLKNPHHPVRLAMPNHNVIVAGKRHLDTVSTSTSLNSEIMQRLMDEPTSVQAAR